MTAFQSGPSLCPGAIMSLCCSRCGHEWVGVEAAGKKGVICPKCGLIDREFVWTGPRTGLSHDGTWLTGGYALPWWPTCPHPSAPAAASAQDAQATDEIDPYTGEPRSFWRRWAQRLLTAWWALKGEW